MQVVPAVQEPCSIEAPIQITTAVLRVGSCFVGAALQAGWLLGRRSDSVRQQCPVRAGDFRHVLPRVVGCPHRGVLCVIRLPSRLPRAFPVTVLLHCPVARSASSVRFQPRSVSGFPLACPKSCRPSLAPSRSQERLGPPTFVNGSLPACHGRRTPADLHILALTDAAVWLAVCVKTLSVRTGPVQAVPALQGARSPLRPPGYAVDASSILFATRSLTTPPWTQDSIRVGGYPLPHRDFHPARDAKLVLARYR
jgi:hypothetical protein